MQTRIYVYARTHMNAHIQTEIGTEGHTQYTHTHIGQRTQRNVRVEVCMDTRTHAYHMAHFYVCHDGLLCVLGQCISIHGYTHVRISIYIRPRTHTHPKTRT